MMLVRMWMGKVGGSRIKVKKTERPTGKLSKKEHCLTAATKSIAAACGTPVETPAQHHRAVKEEQMNLNSSSDPDRNPLFWMNDS